MSQFRRLFDRELSAFERWLSRRPGAAPGSRPRPRGRAAGRGGQRPRPTRRPRWRRRLRPFFQSASGFALSVFAHLILLGFFVALLPERPATAPAGPVEMTIHLVRPGDAGIRPQPEPEAEAPDSPPSPQPASPAPSAESQSKPPVATAAPREPAAPRAPREPEVALGARRNDLSPPPLPSRAERVSRSTNRSGSAGASGAKRHVGGSLRWTRGEGRGESLEAHGGGGGTEDAVQRGLSWLARHQDDDGKWDSDAYTKHCPGFRPCEGTGRSAFDVGVTSLAALAFLGAGIAPDTDSPYSKTIERALQYLLDEQREEGAVGPRSQWFFYNHALATLVFAEAYGLSPDPRFHEAARRALRYSGRYQQPGGGWDYTEEVRAPGGRNDLSITGWQVMAIHAARSTGVPLPAGMVERVERFLDRAVSEDGSALYADAGDGEGRRGINMVAVGLLSRLYTGTSIADRRSRRAVRRLLASPPDPDRADDWARHFQSKYYWYTGTLAVFHIGGREWQTWNHVLKRIVLPTQSERGHELGSWDLDSNWVDAFGGRVATTALMVLTFEVYYRYPPLHASRRP